MTDGPLVGRNRELASALALIERGARLLTLWGAPGIGKTRLAREVCTTLEEPAWVGLAGARGLAGLQAAVAPMLPALNQRWLVLDNVEHLVDDPQDGVAVVTQIEEWLDTYPRASILTTSRRLLRLKHEQAVAIQPLAPPDALALFEAQVRRHRPDYATQPPDRDALLALVGALDGLPLAVELAASRWDLLGTEGLVKRLAEPLAVLARPRATDPRHATLRKAIAWSWELLEPADQAVLKAMATFAGPFSASDAEAVVGIDALVHLEALRDSALVQVLEPGRFELLSSVRAFARECASAEEAAQLAEAHARWCLARHPDWTYASVPPEQRDDLEAAARWLVERADPRASAALLLLGSAAPGQHLALLDDAVARIDAPLVRRARGRAHRLRGQYVAAARDFEAGLAAAVESGVRMQLRLELGALWHQSGDLDAASQHYAGALACAREANDPRGEAMVEGNLGAIDHDLCKYERAEERYENALRGLRRAGDRRAEATVLANQAVLRQEEGQLEAAEAAYRGALVLHRDLTDPHMQAITEGNLGMLLQELGRLPQAREMHLTAWARLQDIPDAKSRALCQARLGAVEASLGDTAASRSHFADAARLAALSDDEVTAAVVRLFEAFLLRAEGRTDEVLKRLNDAAEPSRISGDARVAVRLLRGADPGREPALEVGDTWFAPPSGGPSDLSRHASLRRMFLALVSLRERDPKASLDVDGLFSAGWPGETIAAESIRNRVHVNLAKLRTMGLRGVLRRTTDGYQLDPTVPIRHSA